MKQMHNSGIYIFMAIIALTLSLNSCQKKPSDIKTPLVVGADDMYPATKSFYDQGNGAYPTVFTYTYDKNNKLTRFGKDSVLIREINDHGVLETTYDLPLWIFQTGYTYSTVNGTADTAVSLYTGSPNQVAIVSASKDLKSGVAKSSPSGLWNIFYNKTGLELKDVTSDGGGRNYNYSYDANGNLSEIDFVSLSGPRSGAVYSRLKVTSVDDKHSPFSAVVGYRFAAWPAAYPSDYATAYCKNNPKEITVDEYDADKNTLVPYEKDEFAYVYNDKGYPTTITVTKTYFTGAGSTYVKTFNYTYKTK